MKAIIYTRQSVAREDSISHELQENACRAYAKSKGYDVLRVETDPGISGLNLKKRKALARAIEAVQAGEAQRIIVWRWSRLSRARVHQAKLLSDVETAGGQVESALEPMDSSAAGRFGRDVLLAMAAFESEQKAETWKQSHERRVENKLPPHGRQYYGYIKTKTGYEVDPVTAPLLKEAYRMYTQDKVGFKTISNYLNEHGTPAASGTYMDAQKIRKTMDNPFATGRYRFRGEEHEGAHDAIISEGMWRAYKKAREDRADIAPRATSSTHFLGGLAFCYSCGASMVKHTTRGTNYYYCSRARKGGDCKGVRSNWDLVGIELVRWVGKNYAAMAAALPSDDVLAKAEEAVQNAEEVRDKAKANINDLLSRAVRLNLDDAVIEDSLKKFQAELAEAEEDLNQALIIQGNYVAPSTDLERLFRGWLGMTDFEKKALIHRAVAGVIVLPDNVVRIVPRKL